MKTLIAIIFLLVLFGCTPTELNLPCGEPLTKETANILLYTCKDTIKTIDFEYKSTTNANVMSVSLPNNSFIYIDEIYSIPDSMILSDISFLYLPLDVSAQHPQIDSVVLFCDSVISPALSIVRPPEKKEICNE